MKTKDVFIRFNWFIIGSISSMLLLHFRFKNDLLRRELILFMQDGSEYFLMFVYLDIMFLIMVYLTYFLISWGLGYLKASHNNNNPPFSKEMLK